MFRLLALTLHDAIVKFGHLINFVDEARELVVGSMDSDLRGLVVVGFGSTDSNLRGLIFYYDFRQKLKGVVICHQLLCTLRQQVYVPTISCSIMTFTINKLYQKHILIN